MYQAVSLYAVFKVRSCRLSKEYAYDQSVPEGSLLKRHIIQPIQPKDVPVFHVHRIHIFDTFVEIYAISLPLRPVLDLRPPSGHVSSYIDNS